MTKGHVCECSHIHNALPLTLHTPFYLSRMSSDMNDFRKSFQYYQQMRNTSDTSQFIHLLITLKAQCTCNCYYYQNIFENVFATVLHVFLLTNNTEDITLPTLRVR
jgi:hypothetical protein